MVVHMRHTKGHTANRRSHHALLSPRMSVCSSCKAKVRPHTMCANCGNYRGKVVLDVAALTAKAQAKTKKREAAETSAK